MASEIGLVGLAEKGERVPGVDALGDHVVANTEPHDPRNFEGRPLVRGREAIPNDYICDRRPLLLDDVVDRVRAVGERGQEMR